MEGYWQVDLISDRIKWEFFQAVAVSVLPYSCTTLTNKTLEDKLLGNHTKMLCAILNKSSK